MAGTFSPYIVKAAEYLNERYNGLGYDLYGRFTHDLPYGGQPGVIPATRGDGTMCVAAQAEVFITALDLYYQDTRDASVFEALPVYHWKRWRQDSETMLQWIWVNPPIGAYGAGAAFAHFGIGEQRAFDALEPGAFLNFNFTTSGGKGLGHAVVFIDYLTLDGGHTTASGDDVAGFRFFSSQGRTRDARSGLGYRVTMRADRAARVALSDADAGIRYPSFDYSDDPHFLHGGVVYHPKHWGADGTPAEADEAPGDVPVTADDAPPPDDRYVWNEDDYIWSEDGDLYDR
jgi:hypothetical protein